MSTNQISAPPKISQSGFEGLEIQPIRFQGAGNSAKHGFKGLEFSQSGFEGLEIQPIRFRGAGNSANQILRG